MVQHRSQNKDKGLVPYEVMSCGSFSIGQVASNATKGSIDLGAELASAGSGLDTVIEKYDAGATSSQVDFETVDTIYSTEFTGSLPNFEAEFKADAEWTLFMIPDPSKDSVVVEVDEDSKQIVARFVPFVSTDNEVADAFTSNETLAKYETLNPVAVTSVASSGSVLGYADAVLDGQDLDTDTSRGYVYYDGNQDTYFFKVTTALTEVGFRNIVNSERSGFAVKTNGTSDNTWDSDDDTTLDFSGDADAVDAIQPELTSKTRDVAVEAVELSESPGVYALTLDQYHKDLFCVKCSVQAPATNTGAFSFQALAGDYSSSNRTLRVSLWDTSAAAVANPTDITGVKVHFEIHKKMRNT
jgi:hypothetical protein